MKPSHTKHSAGGAATCRLQSELRSILGSLPRVRPAELPRVLSHFELLKKIGSGAKATIFKGLDQRLRRTVAIKMLRPSASPESRRRFLREAACGAAITHPNIASIYELVRHEGRDSIVMEYVPGKTLNRVVPRRGFPLVVCLDYTLQIAKAIAAVHAAKIIHRDLKPANLVVMPDGTIKLLDFGLAKTIGKPGCQPKAPELETHQGTIMGTVGYMSPEQVRGEPTDQRTDFFSFGAVFYELLSGRRAFHEATPIETMSAILHATPRKLPQRVPQSVARIVGRCLQKDPRRRYQTAKDLVIDLMWARNLAERGRSPNQADLFKRPPCPSHLSGRIH